MGYHSFEDLDVWKKACALTVKLYKMLKACTDYGLKDQMTRAAVSIASNIETFGKLQHCHCERSEAISKHVDNPQDCHVALLLAMTRIDQK